MKTIFYILIGILSILLNEESSASCWRFGLGLSPLLAFIIVSGLGLSVMFFLWLPLYNKVFTKAEKLQNKHIPDKGAKKFIFRIAQWITKKHNYFEKNKDKNIVKKIRALGHFGLFIGGMIPLFFHPTMCAYKILIQTKFGPLCIWAGAVIRLAISVFGGFKLIDSIF